MYMKDMNCKIILNCLTNNIVSSTIGVIILKLYYRIKQISNCQCHQKPRFSAKEKLNTNIKLQGFYITYLKLNLNLEISEFMVYFFLSKRKNVFTYFYFLKRPRNPVQHRVNA